MNAGKHLVFSSETVAAHESRDEFDQLLSRLHDELAPRTQIEISILDRLAATLWRERRLLNAERQWLDQAYSENRKKPGFVDELALSFDTPTKIAPVDALPIGQQILIGRYQVMLTNQARGLLDELRREQARRAEDSVIEGSAVQRLPN